MFPPLDLRAFAALADGPEPHGSDHGRMKIAVPKALTDGRDLDGVAHTVYSRTVYPVPTITGEGSAIMANTRVKVRREVLIEKLEAERKRIVAAHDAEVRKAEKQRAAVLELLRAELDDLAALIVDDPDAIFRRVERYYRSNKRDGLAIRFPRLTLPVEPPDAAQTYKLDRSIAVLKAAEDDTLSISATDEYAKYL